MSRADPRSLPVATACRSCGHQPLTEILDLGAHPEANTFPDSAENVSLQPRWPLHVFICDLCSLVQLDDSGPAERALPGPPAYELSETMRAHAQRFVDDVLTRHPLRADDHRVVELASHGTYLHPFLAERGIRSLIVEGSPLWPRRPSGTGTRFSADRSGLPLPGSSSRTAVRQTSSSTTTFSPT